MDISQATFLTVDFIFALARAVIAARDRHIVFIAVIQPSVGIIKAQSNLGIAQSLSLACAAENNILHPRSAQGFGGLLAENPAHGVGNIALARAVGADNRRYSLAEFKHGFIRKGFEALHFKRF